MKNLGKKLTRKLGYIQEPWVPVGLSSRPSRSIDIGDVSQTNGPPDPKQFDRGDIEA